MSDYIAFDNWLAHAWLTLSWRAGISRNSFYTGRLFPM